jgi:outer membrane lipoprotein LolB
MRGFTLRGGIAAMLAALALSACAPTTRLQAPAGPQDVDDRTTRLQAIPGWTLTGRIAVSDGRDGGSGRIDWSQDGDHYDIAVRAPVAGGSWRLSGDGSLAQLDGVGEQPLRDSDAAALLARELGWHLPMAQVADWVRGLPADPLHAQIEAGADGLPALLREAGWTVEYRDWIAVEGLAMPRRLVARRAPFEVRIAVQRWGLDGNP